VSIRSHDDALSDEEGGRGRAPSRQWTAQRCGAFSSSATLYLVDRHGEIEPFVPVGSPAGS